MDQLNSNRTYDAGYRHAERPLEGYHLLIIDDDPDILLIFDWTLSRCGATVKTASSASSAWEILTQEAFDVLLCDIGMPEIDGYQFIHCLRTVESAKGRQTPAVAVSGYADDAYEQKAYDCGFQSYLLKPVVAEEMVAAIVTAMEKTKARRSDWNH